MIPLLLTALSGFLVFDLVGIIPQRKVLIGAWTEGFFDGTNKKLRPEKLLEFEKLVNKKMKIAHYYIGWEVLASPDLLSQFETIRSNGWVPMLNVNPYYFDKCFGYEKPLYRAIAQGDCDEFLHSSGKNLAKIKEPFYLVFAWEMNNDVNEWSVLKSGSTNDEFVAAWRRIHNIFRQERALNIIWVFCPNVPEESVSPYAKIYPGDKYVDWIGLDGYNWGTTQSWSEWVDFAGVFTGSYNSLVSVAPEKPLMLAEVNTTDKGGDKPAWYKDMFLKQIPGNFPNIRAVIIFNEDKTGQEGVNWRVDVTEESLKAFKESVGSKYYNF